MEPHEVLGVSADADPDEVRAAHRRLVRLHHPDRHAAASPEAQAAAARRTAEVNEALELLLDPDAMARRRARTHRTAGTGTPSASTETRWEWASDAATDEDGGKGSLDDRRAAAGRSDWDMDGRWSRTPPPPRSHRPATPDAEPRQPRPRARPRTVPPDGTPFGLKQAVGWALLAAVFGAGFLLLTDTGRQLLEDVTGAGPAASADVATVPVPGPASQRPVDVDGPMVGVTVPLDAGIGRTHASDLRTGSCYDSTTAESADGSFDVTGVTERACTEPHENQALIVVELEADRTTAYPGRDAVLAALEPICDLARERVLGPEPGPDWSFATLHPSPDSWAGGDRQGVCEVSLRDGSLLEAPLADAPS